MTQHDRIKAYLADLVRLFTRHVDYHAHYPYEVMGQNGDGSLEVRPQGSAAEVVPPFSRVPIRTCPPGATFKVKKGSSVLVGFEAGSPTAPYASLWGASDVTEVVLAAETKYVIKAGKIHLGDEGGNPVARIGDPIIAVLPAQMPISGAMIIPPSPTPVTFTALMTVADPITGIIEGGSDVTSSK